MKRQEFGCWLRAAGCALFPAIQKQSVWRFCLVAVTWLKYSILIGCLLFKRPASVEPGGDLLALAVPVQLMHLLARGLSLIWTRLGLQV